MNSLSILFIFVACAAAIDNKQGQNERCALTERATKDTACSYFLARSNEFRKMDLDTFDKLNPHVECTQADNIIRKGAEICLYAHSKFDEVQEQDALQKFMGTANRLASKRRNSNYKGLVNRLQHIADGLYNARAKRDVTRAKELEIELIMNVSDPDMRDFVKDVTNANVDLKAMEDEVEKGRQVICDQLNKEEGSQPNEYTECVCGQNKGPYIYCQSLLMKHEVEKNNYRGDPTEPKIPEVPQRHKRAIKCDDGGSGGKMENVMGKLSNKQLHSFMSKGCQTVDCLKTLCVSAECCVMIPKLPILSICAEAGGCVPNLMTIERSTMAMSLYQFSNSKLFAKFGLCLTDFGDILSFIGLEKCLASVELAYYYFRNAITVTPQIALVVVKASVTANLQLPSFQKFRNVYNDTKTMDDLCEHEPYRCEEYCADSPQASFGYSVDVWFFWWRTVSTKTLASTYECPPKPKSG